MSSFKDLSLNDSMAQSIQVMNQDLIRLDRFNGHNFMRWQEKVLFFLTAIKLSYILGDDLASIPEDAPEDDEKRKEELKAQRQKRKDDDFLCRGHILNALSDSVYSAHRTIYCDSKATLYKVANKTYNGKQRHLSLRHQSIRSLLKQGVITVDYVESKNNLADPLTKGLARDLITKTSKGMGLRSM